MARYIDVKGKIKKNIKKFISPNGYEYNEFVLSTENKEFLIKCYGWGFSIPDEAELIVRGKIPYGYDNLIIANTLKVLNYASPKLHEGTKIECGGFTIYDCEPIIKKPNENNNLP